MTDDSIVIAEGHDIVFLRSRVRPHHHVGLVLEDTDGIGWLNADTLRWLIHTGGPAALAALDRPEGASR